MAVERYGSERLVKGSQYVGIVCVYFIMLYFLECLVRSGGWCMLRLVAAGLCIRIALVV